MQPIGRLIDHLGHQRREHHDRAADQNHEHRRAVAGIGETVVLAATLARRTQCQKALEQLALAAGRTAAAQATADRQGGRRQVGSMVSHGRILAGEKRKRAASPPPLRGNTVGGQCPWAALAPEPHTYMQANRNSHTTSTKCQYQAANSKPRCWVGVEWPMSARSRQTIRKIEPMMTCTPWKPVAMKKVAP